MSAFDDPFNPDHKLGCGCGRHASAAAHDAAYVPDAEVLTARATDAAVMRALFPHDPTRRRFLQAVGASTALAAVEQVFPLGAARALAQDKPGTIEKKDLKIGFIPITCATPIIM